NYVITATGGLANTNLPQFTTAGVTGTPAVGSVTTIRDGTGNEMQTLTFGGAASGTLIPAFNGGSATITLTNTAGTSPTAAQVQASLVIIPYLTGNVTVIGPVNGPFLIVFSGSLSGVDVPAIDVSNVGAGGTASVVTNFNGIGN